MTSKKQDLALDTGGGAIDQPEVRTDLDPISVVTALAADDPSLGELAAFRTAIPDIKLAARQAKRLRDESVRIRLSELESSVAHPVAAGLTLIGLGYQALVMIWPADTLDVVDGKLALAEVTGPLGRQDADYVPQLGADTARRIRVQRAAFNVGELVVPPGPTPPASDARGLADWPLSRLDLATLLPPRGGVPAFADKQVQHWSQVVANAPDLAGVAERLDRLLATADRLFALAQIPSENLDELRRAAEGAQILAYLCAAQVAIGPVAKGTPGIAVKRRVAAAINDRACRADPLHMQAAIRTLFEEGSWVAKLVDPDRMAVGIPTWIEIV